MTEGILYAATGEDFIREAKISAKTVRKSIENINIAIATDRDHDLEAFDDVIHIADPSYGFVDKIKAMKQTPYDKTIFIDTDTYISQDFSELFDLLERFDIAATHNQNRDLYTGISLGVCEAFPEYSSGVVAYKKASMDSFFDAWLAAYKDDHRGDQPSFRKTLYNSNLRIATIPREYNLSPRYPSHVAKPIKIFHGRLLDIDSPGANKNFELKNVISKMNNYNGHRLFDKGGYQLVPNNSLIYKFIRSINSNGLLGTAKMSFNKLYNSIL